MSFGKINLLHDIYYKKKYVALYLKDGDSIFKFKYQEDNNIFYNIAIKRPILKIGNVRLDDIYYDLETAYGYGGFYTNCNEIDFIKKAMSSYTQRCKEEKIIAEFIRFHPFNEFPLNFGEFLDFNVYDRDVVVVDLQKDVWMSYSSKVRNIIKKAQTKLTLRESKNIEKFAELYYFTMKKNKAKEFYFFTGRYFEELLLDDDVYLYEVEYADKIVAMGFFMYGKDIVHYHLSANSVESYKLNANYFLLNELFKIAKMLGKEYFILGGGSSSNKDDTLFKFKKKFSKLYMPFYIGGNIYNKRVYDKFVNIWKEQSKLDVQYFLKYRLEI